MGSLEHILRYKDDAVREGMKRMWGVLTDPGYHSARSWYLVVPIEKPQKMRMGPSWYRARYDLNRGNKVMSATDYIDTAGSLNDKFIADVTGKAFPAALFYPADAPDHAGKLLSPYGLIIGINPSAVIGTFDPSDLETYFTGLCGSIEMAASGQEYTSDVLMEAVHRGHNGFILSGNDPSLWVMGGILLVSKEGYHFGEFAAGFEKKLKTEGLPVVQIETGVTITDYLGEGFGPHAPLDVDDEPKPC